MKERKDRTNEEKDLLQSILKNSIGEGVDKSFIVDNCKNIYFAGQETTATTAKWVLLLLASHPQWQARVREEVMDVCGGQKPDPEKLKKLTLVSYQVCMLMKSTPISFNPSCGHSI